ncbi:MAG TPA: right-handed parallel beta-helix repeat-containing protein [Candidatus Hydrogenedentes bacterium]|nr:right-handed parallel beta-helix repeat-containing protein [Candidatus Hydrogenedentota bacterium]HPG68161.1 right-handed parallel beta-helix repeat-containing protein [Candidatus Hydrogenedentota bacterium]
MDCAENMRMNRRDLLRVASGVAAGAVWARGGWADGLPAITRPRATSGDSAVEPDWAERLTVTVGPKDADLVGDTEKPIQAALDYVARLGTGTVHVLPGTYRMRNSLFLRANVRLLGSGQETVLIKQPSIETTLAEDSDWYDQEVTLVDADGFDVGDGVVLRTENVHHGGLDVLRRTLVARTGNRFKLDRALRENFWTLKAPTISTLFPMLTAEETDDLAVESLVLDGNRSHNGHIDGNYAGAIWFQDCSRIVLRGLTMRNYNGDGASWQVCHDVLVEDCHSHDNADLGLHPGSGSQRPIIRRNVLERNDIGLFFCWGVKYGLAEENVVRDNASYGISIGHRDNENVIRGNEVCRNGRAGVVFRPERGKGFAAWGNLLEANRIVDNGADDGVGIDIQGTTESVVLERNEVRETRGPASRVGVRLGPESRDVRMVDNQIDGFARPVEDLRTE